MAHHQASKITQPHKSTYTYNALLNPGNCRDEGSCDGDEDGDGDCAEDKDGVTSAANRFSQLTELAAFTDL